MGALSRADSRGKARVKAAILAGGLGTRFRPVLVDRPKPLAEIQGRPLLEWQLECCRRNGITEIVLITGHAGEKIQQVLGDGSRLGVHLEYLHEKQLLGTGGGLRALYEIVEEPFLVIYGDVFFDMDLGALLRFHQQRQPEATVVVHAIEHPHEADIVESSDDRIVCFHGKGRAPECWLPNRVNAGIFVVSRRLLERIPAGQPCDLGRDVLPGALLDGANLCAYFTREYLRDMGTPSRYAAVESDVQNGRPARWHYSNPRPAVFLDRDGTLIVLREFITKPEDLSLYPEVGQALRLLRRTDFLAVACTNQPQIARGMMTVEGLRQIHYKMETLLGREGAWLDLIEYCPHHPDAGYPGEVKELKIPCQCRKPGTLMYRRAAQYLNIDLSRSWVIGDSARDIGAARNMGCGAVLVRNSPEKLPPPVRPDYFAHDLLSAVEWILARAGV